MLGGQVQIVVSTSYYAVGDDVGECDAMFVLATLGILPDFALRSRLSVS